jgi:hypothetical protein
MKQMDFNTETQKSRGKGVRPEDETACRRKRAKRPVEARSTARLIVRQLPDELASPRQKTKQERHKEGVLLT